MNLKKYTKACDHLKTSNLSADNFKKILDLAPVVRKEDSAIYWINYYPLDSAISCRNAYPLNSDLSGG